MEIIKCSDFINEARVNKKDVVDALLDLFKSKRNVEMDKLPNERGLYSLAGMKKALSGQFDSNHVDNALHDLMNDKKSGIKSKGVDISLWGSSVYSPQGGKGVPYWYIGLSDDQVDKLKAEYEKEEREKNKDVVEKSKENRRKSRAESEIKANAKADAKVKTKSEGAERKPGTASKKTAKIAKKK